VESERCRAGDQRTESPDWGRYRTRGDLEVERRKIKKMEIIVHR